MDLDEALALLGLADGANRKGARRAYLQLIRVYKPDRAPEQFKRVREAFEICKARLPERATEQATERTPVVIDLPSPAFAFTPEPVLEFVPEFVPEPVPEPPSAPETPAEAVPEISLESVAPVNSEGWRERVAADLDDIEAWWGLWRTLHGEGDWQAAEVVLRRAVNQGHAEFLPQMWNECPERLSLVELRPLAVDRALAEVAERGLAAATQGAFDNAELLTEVVSTGMRDAHDLEIEPGVVCELALRLAIEGRLDAAEELVQSADYLLHDVGIVRRAGDYVAFQARLSTELFRLPRTSPRKLRTILAEQILEGDLDVARARLSEWAARYRVPAALAAEALKQHAPLLQQIVGGALTLAPKGGYDAGAADDDDSKSEGSSTNYWLLFIGLSIVIRLCSAMGDGELSSPTEYVPPELAREQPWSGPAGSTVHTGTLCAAQPQSCAEAEKVRTLLSRQAGRCDDSLLPPFWRLNNAQATGANREQLEDLRRRLRAEVESACPALSLPPVRKGAP